MYPQNKDLRGALRSAQEPLKGLQSRVRRLQRLLKGLQSRVRRLQRPLKGLQSRVRRLQRLLKGFQKQLKALQRQVKTIHNRLKVLEERVKGIRTAVMRSHLMRSLPLPVLTHKTSPRHHSDLNYAVYANPRMFTMRRADQLRFELRYLGALPLLPEPGRATKQ